jgi:hypothetical protein
LHKSPSLTQVAPQRQSKKLLISTHQHEPLPAKGNGEPVEKGTGEQSENKDSKEKKKKGKKERPIVNSVARMLKWILWCSHYEQIFFIPFSFLLSPFSFSFLRSFFRSLPHFSHVFIVSQSLKNSGTKIEPLDHAKVLRRLVAYIERDPLDEFLYRSRCEAKLIREIKTYDSYLFFPFSLFPFPFSRFPFPFSLFPFPFSLFPFPFSLFPFPFSLFPFPF